ncbi:MAG: hypothetical protein VX034_08585, partial [Planctomycetota bacterium]|nr:hypothetical protein [Planctomycetota bacterium]
CVLKASESIFQPCRIFDSGKIISLASNGVLRQGMGVGECQVQTGISHGLGILKTYRRSHAFEHTYIR